jgi:hypothetical protein
VAGDGTTGFAGDGGPATKAELSDMTDLTFAPNGDLYLADNGRVRVIDPQASSKPSLRRTAPTVSLRAVLPPDQLHPVPRLHQSLSARAESFM